MAIDHAMALSRAENERTRRRPLGPTRRRAGTVDEHLTFHRRSIRDEGFNHERPRGGGQGRAGQARGHGERQGC